MPAVSAAGRKGARDDAMRDRMAYPYGRPVANAV